MIQVKAINPKQFADKAVVGILKNELNRLAGNIEDDFLDTVRTWEHQPSFRVKRDLTFGNWVIEVSTEDEIYGYVTHGTKPHTIRPKHAKALRFQGGYTSKTVPGVIPARAGGASGETVVRPEVHHPGTTARRFAEQISLRRNREFRIRMVAAMKLAAQASGHGV